MVCGKMTDKRLDPLTAWELVAINLLIGLKPEDATDVKASCENMLALMRLLDKGKLDAALSNPEFLTKTENLLLAILRGEPIEVADPTTYNARREIIAAAQVIYNQAVARDLWPLHKDISKAMTEV